MTAGPGFEGDEYFGAHTLRPGTRLREYRIDKVIGEGGFGIVYLAFDTALERRVAIKEYLPTSMAARATAGHTVVIRSPSHAATFAVGLRSFVNEARLLARFEHPALVKVHQFWEDNGTAYMAMPYYEGPTLRAVLSALGRPPTEAEVRRWLDPLMDALAALHAERCWHRDIAPDNVLITATGPLLLDFGAARQVIGDVTHTLTAVLKPGYAPIEQYGEMPNLAQGPWTDIYALASVLYGAIGGARPAPSVERLMEDRLRPLAQLAAGRYRPGFLAAIDRALAIRPEERPQSIAEFRALLDADGPLPASLPAATQEPRPMPATVVVPAAAARARDVDIGLDDWAAAPAAPGPGTPARPPWQPAPQPAPPQPQPPQPPPPRQPLPQPAVQQPPPQRPLAQQAAQRPLPNAPLRQPSGRSYQAPRGTAVRPPAPAQPSSQRRLVIIGLATAAAAATGWGAWRLFGTQEVQGAQGRAAAAGAASQEAPRDGATAAAAPREAAARASARPAAPATAGTGDAAGRARDQRARCAAIRDKASRQTISREEAEFLRRECR
ncbi:MAG: serine/threonine protein kinase [Rubrivivax sp.]|nr:serine/threonine protein kinase [Rubrivivax sp.]